MNDDALMEAVASAWRDVGPDGLSSSPAWHDLGDAGRVEAFERSIEQRRLEAAVDPAGLNGTVHAVLRRLQASD